MNFEKLDRKIKWYLKNVEDQIDTEAYILIKLSKFDDEGNLTFRKVKWRDFNEFK